MRRSAGRSVLSGLAGITGGVLAGSLGRWMYAAPVGWLVAAAVFLTWTWLAVGRLDADETAARATCEDPTRADSDLIVIAASVASLGGVIFLLTQADSGNRGLTAAVGLASVAASWLVVHTLFTLRYALLYYTPPHGGVDFNQQARPTYRDFAYLSFTLGMTYQVSDTNLETPQIRATALRHALLSYLLGAVVLAATINLVVGLGTSG